MGLVTLAGLISACQGSKNQSSLNGPIAGAIVGGQKAEIPPYFVSLVDPRRPQELDSDEGSNRPFLSPSCGGTLIKPGVVLTAAHCLSPGAPIGLLFSNHSSSLDQINKFVEVKQVIVHPSYRDLAQRIARGGLASADENADSFNADLALLFFDVEEQPPTAKPLPINRRSQWPRTNHLVTAMGWGCMSNYKMVLPQEFQSIQIPVIDAAEYVRQHFSDSQSQLDQPSLLAAGKLSGGGGSCFGDSGGPLVVADEEGHEMLVGVTSFGEPGPKHKLFNGPLGITLYQRLSYYQQWIHQSVAIVKEQNTKALDMTTLSSLDLEQIWKLSCIYSDRAEFEVEIPGALGASTFSTFNEFVINSVKDPAAESSKSADAAICSVPAGSDEAIQFVADKDDRRRVRVSLSAEQHHEFRVEQRLNSFLLDCSHQDKVFMSGRISSSTRGYLFWHLAWADSNGVIPSSSDFQQPDASWREPFKLSALPFWREINTPDEAFVKFDHEPGDFQEHRETEEIYRCQNRAGDSIKITKIDRVLERVDSVDEDLSDESGSRAGVFYPITYIAEIRVPSINGLRTTYLTAAETHSIAIRDSKLEVQVDSEEQHLKNLTIRNKSSEFIYTWELSCHEDFLIDGLPSENKKIMFAHPHHPLGSFEPDQIHRVRFDWGDGRAADLTSFIAHCSINGEPLFLESDDSE